MSFNPKIKKRAKVLTLTASVPIEAMRLHQIIKAPINQTMLPTSGEIAIVVAAEVMPPAPPLKLLKIGQLCPMMAAPPASAAAK